MKPSVTKSVAMLIASVILFALSSCSGNSNGASPLEAVPDGSRQIMTMNLNKIAAANGATKISADGKLTTEAEQALGLFISNDLFSPLSVVLANAEKAVATDMAVTFRAANGYSGLILAVTDYDLLTGDLLAAYRDESSDTDDFKCYNINGRIVAISEDLCVIAPDIETVKKTGQKTGSEYLEKNKGVKKYLNDDDDQAIKVATLGEDIFGKKIAGLWLCGAMRFSDDKAVLDIKAMSPDGTVDKIGERIAAPINRNVVSFVPQNSSLVVATGHQPESSKLFGVEQLLNGILPIDRGMSPITASPDGTTLWYVRPAGTITAENMLSPLVWNIASVIEMNKQDGESAVSQFKRATLGHADLDPETGCYSLSFGDASMSFGYVDGFFLQSINGQITSGNSNPYEKEFQNSRVIAILDVPTGSSLQSACGLPCGASLQLKVNDEAINIALRFYGNDKPVLATINEIAIVSQFLPFILNSF